MSQNHCPENYECIKQYGKELLISKANDISVINYDDGNKSEMYTFYHASTDRANTLLDYRYIGNVPNNYITFNNETWRIIGVIEGRIKIIKDTSLGNLSLDYKESGVGSSSSSSGSNDWTDSQLMYMLNGTSAPLKSGYSNDGTYIRDANNKIGYQLGCQPASAWGSSYSCTTRSWSLNATALSQVDSVTWYLGGSSSDSGHSADTYYAFERGTTVYSGRPTSWEGKVGLMNPSDYAYTYAYGVNGKCYSDTYNCQSGTPEAGWLYNSAYQWTLSPRSGIAYYVFSVHKSGYVSHLDASSQIGVRPTVHLRSDIGLTGSGTSSDPYKIV